MPFPRFPEGEFDAVRIEAEIDYCGEAIVGYVPHALELTYWYAAAAKRDVKARCAGSTSSASTSCSSPTP